MCNDIMHAIELMAPPSTSMRAVHVANLVLAHCQFYVFVNLQTHSFVQVPQVRDVAALLDKQT